MSTLATTALESFIPSIVLGIFLAAIVALSLRLLAPMNAATRALIWLACLVSLPLIQVIYLSSHLTVTPPQAAPIRQVTTISEPIPQTAAVPATQPTNHMPVITRHIEIPVPSNAPADLLALYAVILGFLLFRLFLSYLRLCLLRWRTQPAPADIASRLQHWLVRCPTSRPVKVRLSNSARSPLAIGWFRPIIVMPTALVLELSQQDFDNLGVHELAHIRRYDDWTNLLQRLLQAVLFFHPAAHYISRQLCFEREVACDDWVVAANQSKSYARCLAKVVELNRYRRGSLLLSSGAFFGKRQILKRVATLLDKTRNSATHVSSLTVIAVLAILIGIATQVVNLPAVVAFTQDERNATNIRWSDGSHDFRITYRGDITFSPDEQSVAGLSPAGFLSIDESKGWSHRRIEVRPGPTGAPVEKYFIDGREKPIDGVGRAWAASSYLFLLRETGLDADARVGRILASRGPTGVLEEIDLIHSDHVKCDYLNQLMQQATLNTAELQRVADSARKISSDNDKADFLLAHQRDFITPDLRTSYFRAINSINSDNDRRRVLTGILEADGRSPETARLVGISAKSMNSDNDKAEVLLAMPAASSGETHCALLNAARTIQSDNDKARVLRETTYTESSECSAAYFAVVNLIQSDNDRSNVLQNLLTQPNLQPHTYGEIAASAKGMSSGNDKANVLTLLASHYVDTPFFEAADTIDSGNDRARVLNSVLEHNAGTPLLLQVINSASTLAGDNEKTEILLNVAKQSNEPEVRTALQKACEKLSSDNDYRRLASAIFDASNRPVTH